MKRYTKQILNIFLCLLLILASFMSIPHQVKAETTVLPDFSEPQDVIAPLSGSPTIYDGATGIEDGKNVLYTTSKSVPAEFSVIDLDNGEVIRTLPMEGATDSWQHKVAPDGTVYVTGGKSIWGYSPETKKITALHQIPDSSVWALAVDEDSNAYIGTFPGGKVVKYDKETKKIKDYGRMIGDISQEYVRSLGYHDGYVYAGTAHTQLVRLNLETGEKENLTEGFDEPGFVYDLDIVDDRYVFARFGTSSNMYIFDIEADEWLDIVINNVKGLHVTDSIDGNVYFTGNGKLNYVNLDTLEVHETNMEYDTGLRGADWVEINGNDELPGKSLVTVMFDGRITFFNIETETVVTYPSIVPGTANVTSHLFSYAEDKMYISGMTGAVGARYNPLTDEAHQFNLGQADVIHEFDGKIYFGVYPSGSVDVLDPEANPNGPVERLFTIGEEQDRVHHMTSGDGKLFIGSLPTYGKLGGAITVYDGSEHKVFRNVVQNQSINGLAYQNGKLYGSTSIHGGLGSSPVADEAKLFIWDPETETKTKEVSLEIPGLTKPDRIGSLIAGKNDDYIWGAAGGVVFALNPETLEVEKHVRIEGRQIGGDVQLEWSEDGLLYANLGEGLNVIHPETLEFKHVADTVAFDIGVDGDIYFSKLNNKTIISKVEVFDGIGGSIKTYLEIENHDFESDLVDGEIPGWSVRQLDENTSFELSENESISGTRSVHLIDATTSGYAALQSDLIPVEPGKEYAAGSNVHLGNPPEKPGDGDFSSNRILLQVRYFDENQKELSDTRGLGIEFNGVNLGWTEKEFKFIPHEDVHYISVLLSSNNAIVSNAYYDDVYVYTEEKPSIDKVDGLNDLTVKYGTTLRNLDLPSKAVVTLNNGSRVSVDLTWNEGEPAYDGNSPGTYLFTGTLAEGIGNPEELTASVTVIVEEEEKDPIGEIVRMYLDIENHDFERDLYENEIPGWSLRQLDEHTSIELSEERSLSGDRSVQLIDASTTGYAALHSDLISVDPGTKYTAGANVYLAGPPEKPDEGSFSSNRTLYQVRYFDENKEELPDYQGLGVEFNGVNRGWTENQFTFTPHENVHYISVLLSSNNVLVSNAYYDDVYVYSEVPTKITDVQPFGDITVDFGTEKEALDLPKTVEVTIVNGETMEIEVDWNDGEPAYDGDTAGTYTFTGTLDTNISNPNELVASIQVIVGEETEEPTAGTLAELSEQLETYIDTNEVRGPLVNQLRNSLKQAEHHLNKGSEQKTVEFIEKFLKHMNNKPMQKHITENAKNDLAEKADNLINQWK